MQPSSVKQQTFDYFPKLPQELRDSIWRECLPRRVVEIDSCYASHNLDAPLDDTSDCDHQARPPTECLMSSTSKLNKAAPIISRVCRESRRVAFETGGWMLKPTWNRSTHRRESKISSTWLDKERDVVHLHWHGSVAFWYHGTGPQGGELIRVESNLSAAKAGCAVDRRLLWPGGHAKPWMEDRGVLERIGRIAVCLKVVCIHAPEGPGIASGLFGLLGEERIILVDALDYDRLGKLWALWDAHRGDHPDPLTYDFFSECHAQHPGSEAQRRRTQTIHKTIEDIQKQWVLDDWDEQDEIPGWTEREHVWLSTPDWVSTRDYTKKGSQSYRRNYMSQWVPNRDHPWMRQVYSRMPDFRPVIMFRLCTDTYYLQRGTTRNNRLRRWDDYWRVQGRVPWRVSRLGGKDGPKSKTRNGGQSGESQ